MKNRHLQQILATFPDYLDVECSNNNFVNCKSAGLKTFIAYNYGQKGKIPLNKESEKFLAKYKLESKFDTLVINKDTGAIETVILPSDEGEKDTKVPVKLRDEQGLLVLAYVKIVIT